MTTTRSGEEYVIDQQILSMLDRTANKIAEAQERYLLSVFGSEEAVRANLRYYVFEETLTMSPETFNPANENYEFKVLSRFKLRRKTPEEQAAYDEQQRTACFADAAECGADR